MAYSDPRTWVTGELVTAALMNAQLRDNLDAVIEGTTGAYVNSVVGPHAIGGSTVDYVRLGLTGGFTSGGASTVAFGLYTSGVLTGHSGDSAAIAGIKANNSIVTAGNCTTIAQLWVSEPQITVGAGAVTNSATVYIEGAASEATNDYALWVDAGATKLDGTVTTGSTLTVGTDLTVTEDLVVSGAGPHAMGAAVNDHTRLILDGAFTSGGASTAMFGTHMSGALTGHSADSDALVGTKLNNSIVTAGNCTTVAQLWVAEPAITVGSGSVTNSASVYIAGAATEATNDFALWVDSGATQLDGTLDVAGVTTLDSTVAITGSATDPEPILHVTRNSAVDSRVVLQLDRNVATNGKAFGILFTGGTSTSVTAGAIYGEILISQVDVTNGAHDSSMLFQTAKDGTVATKMTIDNDGDVDVVGTMTATQYFSGASAAISPDATTNLYASVGASGPRSGMIAVGDGYSRFGLFWYGSYNSLTKLAGNSVFSASKDNASTLNIYYESGNIVYQNKTTTDPMSITYTRLLF